MKELSIPEKITLEKEAAPGIRNKDIPKLAAIAIPGVVIGIIVWAASGERPLVQLVDMIAILVYLFLCYLTVARIDGSQSIWGHLALMVRFQREQQRYYYKQGKENLFYVAADRSPEGDSTGIHQR